MPSGKVKIQNTASLRHRLVDATGSPALADGFNESRHDCLDAKNSFGGIVSGAFQCLELGGARAISHQHMWGLDSTFVNGHEMI